VNYANGDMVGHTGVFEASVIAVEAVDLCIGRLIPVVRELGGAMIVTADHGNADQMYELEKTGEPQKKDDGSWKARTSHSLNRVPCHVYAPSADIEVDPSVEAPGLANVASTLLFLMGYEAPDDYLPSILKAGGGE
jgi:2,3-bisphosphoglycerate-independent phosphoglycerate mutase